MHITLDFRDRDRVSGATLRALAASLGQATRCYQGRTGCAVPVFWREKSMEDSQLISFYDALDDDDRAETLHDAGEIRCMVHRTAQDIVSIGLRLIAVKDRLGHGLFLRWLDLEFSWAERTARRFMQVGDRFKSANLADLSVAPSALYLLAAPSTPDEARDEALTRAESGEEITHARARDIVDKKKATKEAASKGSHDDCEGKSANLADLPEDQDEGEEFPDPVVVLPPLRDELGLVVPEASRAAFQALETFGRVEQALREARKTIDVLATAPGGEELRRKCRCMVSGQRQHWRLERLEGLLADLKYARPYAAVCPYCHARQNGLIPEEEDSVASPAECRACHGAGYITRGAWDGTPADFRALVLHDFGAATEGE